MMIFGNQATKKYLTKILENPLPPLPEDERIYLNVKYKKSGFARRCHCGYDSEKKLWFTGPRNANLYGLVLCYGVNEATSDKAKKLLQDAIGREG